MFKCRTAELTTVTTIEHGNCEDKVRNLFISKAKYENRQNCDEW